MSHHSYYPHHHGSPIRWSKRGIVVALALLATAVVASRDQRSRAGRVQVNFEEQAAFEGMRHPDYHQKLAKEGTCWSRYVGLKHHTNCKWNDHLCPSIVVGNTTYFVCSDQARMPNT